MTPSPGVPLELSADDRGGSPGAFPFPAWRHRLSVLLVVSTLALVFVGGLVTSTGSGLSVPDWPLSYGMVMPPMVGGVFYDDSRSYPLPLAGINYLSFDFKGTGKQLNVFFGGALLIGDAAAKGTAKLLGEERGHREQGTCCKNADSHEVDNLSS